MPEPLLSDAQVQNLQQVFSALGGHEVDSDGNQIYVKGDECLDCIGDLLRAIRKDNEETNGVIHQLARWQVVQRDLIPILQTYTSDKPLCCAALRLIVYMTRPVQKWKEDQAGQLQYMHEQKLTLLGKGVLPAIVTLLVDAISIPPEERDSAALETMMNVLQLLRNLAYVPEGLEKSFMNSDKGAHLQDFLIVRFDQESVFEILLTMASSIEEEVKCKIQVDHVIMEIFYLIFLHTTPDAVLNAPDSKKEITAAAKESLHQVVLKEQEVHERKAHRSMPWARHNRFGGSLWRTLIDEDRVALKLSKNALIEQSLNHQKRKRTTVTPKSARMETMFTTNDSRIGVEAMAILKHVAAEFMDSCYHDFLSFELRKLRSPARTQEKDVTHFFWLEAFFLRYFNLKKPTKPEDGSDVSPFAHVSVSLDLDVIRFLLDKMKLEYMVDPKNFSMLHVCMCALKETLRILDAMEKSEHEHSREISRHVQNNIYYENTLMEVVRLLWKTYNKQTNAYLETLVELTYLLIRLVEGFCSNKPSLYVAKKTRKPKRKLKPEEPSLEGEPSLATQPIEEEDTAAQQSTTEQLFEFETFMERFQQDHIISAYCTLVGRHEELSPTVKLVVVKFIHKLFVGCKQQAMFYKLANLVHFNHALNTPTNDSEYQQLRELLTYMLRQMFKMMATNPILHIEMLFKKTVKDARLLQYGEKIRPDSSHSKTSKHKTPPADAVSKKKKSVSDEDRSQASDDDDDLSDHEDDLDLEIEVIGDHPQDFLIKAVTQYLYNKSKLGYLHWLHEVINDSAEDDASATDPVDLNETVKEAHPYVIVPVREEHWAALNEPYVRLLLRLLSFTPPKRDSSGQHYWRIPSTVSMQQRKALASQLSDCIFGSQPLVELPLDSIFRDTKAAAIDVIKQLSAVRRPKRARKSAVDGSENSKKQKKHETNLGPRMMDDDIADSDLEMDSERNDTLETLPTQANTAETEEDKDTPSDVDDHDATHQNDSNNAHASPQHSNNDSDEEDEHKLVIAEDEDEDDYPKLSRGKRIRRLDDDDDEEDNVTLSKSYNEMDTPMMTIDDDPEQ